MNSKQNAPDNRSLREKEFPIDPRGAEEKNTFFQRWTDKIRNIIDR